MCSFTSGLSCGADGAVSAALCSAPVCISSLAMAEVATAHGRGGGHKAPGSSWETEMCSRDINTSLVGDNLGRGLETFCCSTNSVNDILSPVFSTDLLAHVANVLNCFFPRTTSPCLGYLKTSGLCWQLLLGSKNFPKNLSVQSSTKIVGYIIPSPRKRKWNGHMSTYRMIIIICIITPPCIMLLCRHSHPWGFLTQLKSWLWNRKALHATTVQEPVVLRMDTWNGDTD